MKYKIYKITNIINNKNYIGFTSKTLKERFSKHLRDAKYGRNTFLHRAIRKYGQDNFTIELLYESDDLEEVRDIKENEFINKYDSLWHNGNGYNLTKGGEGSIGLKHSESTRQKMSNSHIGMKQSEATKQRLSKDRIGEKNPNFGKRLSDDTRKKLSTSLSGSNNPRSKTFKVIIPSGEVLIIDDRRDFCSKYHLNYWSVCAATRKNRKYKDYKFEAIED